jgi:serine/threonine protein kinase
MSAHPTSTADSTGASSSPSSNVVGVHYRVGKKVGEGSFGVIYEGKHSREKNSHTCTPNP